MVVTLLLYSTGISNHDTQELVCLYLDWRNNFRVGNTSNSQARGVHSHCNAPSLFCIGFSLMAIPTW